MNRRTYATVLTATGVLGAAALSSVAAFGQDALKVQPGSYRLVLENKSVRVLEYNGLPGMGVCGTGLHSHPAHLTVLLSPARVRVTEGGKTFIATSPMGDVFWSPAVTHETENVGSANVRSLIIEVKAPVNAR
jgi:hypothetical protein